MTGKATLRPDRVILKDLYLTDPERKYVAKIFSLLLMTCTIPYGFKENHSSLLPKTKDCKKVEDISK